MKDKMIPALREFIAEVELSNDVTDLEDAYFVVFATELEEFAKISLITDYLCRKQRGEIAIFKNRNNFSDFGALIVADKEVSSILKETLPFSDSDVLKRAKEMFDKALLNTKFNTDSSDLDYFKDCVWATFKDCSFKMNLDEDIFLESLPNVPAKNVKSSNQIK